MVLLAGFAYTAYLIAAIFSLIIFVPEKQSHPRWHIISLIAVWVVVLFTYRLIDRRFAKHPKSMAVLAFIVMAIFIAGVYWFFEQKLSKSHIMALSCRNIGS
jgi:hypothetical protein